jgi:Leishmanolysin
MPISCLRLAPRQSCALLLLLATACGGDDPIGPPAAIEVVSGNNQSAPVTQPLPSAPIVKVRDANGHGLPAIVVRFSVVAGGGSVLTDSALTDMNGLAVGGQWFLGTVVGVNTLKVQASGLSISTTINATAVAGPPANLSLVSQQNFAALVGQPTSPQPAVLVTDGFGNPVKGAVVTFAVTLNNGSVTGSTPTSDTQGRAAVASWTLGSAGGLNRLSASVSGTNSVAFEAQGLTAAPSIVAVSPVAQSGFLGAMVPRVPQVKVTGSEGQLLGNIPVQFTIVGGGDAVVAGGLAISNIVTGIAAPSDWRLGVSGTSSTVEATIPGFAGPKVLFTSTGTFSPYVIDVRFLTTMSPAQRDAFATAANRWMQIIIGDIPDVPINLSVGSCANGQSPAMNETVDDIVIFAQVVTIDGVGGVLGSAGPCIRRTGSLLTAIGSMRFDIADLVGLQNTSRLEPVILHEMAHVLGFGTIWTDKALLVGAGGVDPVFIGAEALSIWPSFNLGYAGIPVPVENLFGAGTRDSHWRESVLVAELMTGFIEAPGISTPLSKLTIASMKDVGYSISYATADPYAGNLMSMLRAVGEKVALNDIVENAQWEVTPLGVLRRLP